MWHPWEPPDKMLKPIIMYPKCVTKWCKTCKEKQVFKKSTVINFVLGKLSPSSRLNRLSWHQWPFKSKALVSWEISVAQVLCRITGDQVQAETSQPDQLHESVLLPSTWAVTGTLDETIFMKWWMEQCTETLLNRLCSVGFGLAQWNFH